MGRLFLTGLHAIFTTVGGMCLIISVVMFFVDCTGGQARTSENLYYYVWFLGFIAVGIICMVIAGLLSDKLSEAPSDDDQL
jgi:hypothetical protein